MSIEPNSTLVRKSGMMSTRVDGEIVILSMITNNYVGLDDIGARIWDLLETPCKFEDLCLTLCHEFSAPMEVVRPDTLEFLEELLKEDLVDVVKG